MDKRVRQIREFGTIRNAADFPGYEDSADTIYLDPKSFENLKCFVAENSNSANEVDSSFSYHRKNGKDYIRVKNFVGVIETRNGIFIEILPKIYCGSSDGNQPALSESRRTLLSMLMSLRDAPFKTMDKAHLNASKLPLLEIFISLFLEEMEFIVNKGIKHFYGITEENQKFLKGRLLFSNHIRSNATRADRFYIRFDEFKADIPQNRILKTALHYIYSKSRSIKNKVQTADLLRLFEEVPLSKNLKSDLLKINGHNRLFNYYEKALNWAKLFLDEKSFTVYKGNYLNTAILFPMEVLFESYVACKLKQQYPEFTITTQDKGFYLMTDLTLQQSRFRIRPDIVVKINETVVVADTKWKIINQELPDKNYLISPGDLYQMYAYGKKYLCNKLILIYPECESFKTQLLFQYDEQLMLGCYPWSFRRENDVLKTIANFSDLTTIL